MLLSTLRHHGPIVADRLVVSPSDIIGLFRYWQELYAHHRAAPGETSWHEFACAIVDGLHKREIDLAVETVNPVSTDEYPTPARRPLNSRLELARLRHVFGIYPDNWRMGLERELDLLAIELRSSARQSLA